ncbi:coiled-coil domain-containing protein 115-like [Argiope bruennichi]|uniref:coiled-coil domain-containing protein 115-like n=1 Tax=Argiope bruennichi TaxID=94029 RepID=UPI0024941E5E|nr:coiled-coil domain-containing protein 115-like [Argiope bruennichi]
MSEFLEADVVKKMEEVKILYRKLDELSITILRTLQSIMFERKYLDANLQEGYINMAKARYLMRGQKVGIHQVNSTNLTATFKVSSYLDVDEGVEYLNYKLDEVSLPQNDATLKLRSVNVENQLVDDQVSVLAPDEVDCKNEDSKTSKETICSNYNDPLKWFGVLVPESLRTCQTRFKQSTCTALKIISLHNKLRELHKEYKILKLQKASLCSHDLICNNTESECNNSVKS